MFNARAQSSNYFQGFLQSHLPRPTPSLPLSFHGCAPRRGHASPPQGAAPSGRVLPDCPANCRSEGTAQPKRCAVQGPLKQCRHLERVLCALTCPLHCFPSGSVSADSTPLRRTVPIPLTPPAPRASPSLFFHTPDVSYTARSPRAVPAQTSSYAFPHGGCTTHLPPRPDHHRR